MIALKRTYGDYHQDLAGEDYKILEDIENMVHEEFPDPSVYVRRVRYTISKHGNDAELIFDVVFDREKVSAEEVKKSIETFMYCTPSWEKEIETKCDEPFYVDFDIRAVDFVVKEEDPNYIRFKVKVFIFETTRD